VENLDLRIVAVIAAVNLAQDAAGTLRLVSQQASRYAAAEWRRAAVAANVRCVEAVQDACAQLERVHGLAGTDTAQLRKAQEGLHQDLERVRQLQAETLEAPT